MKNKKNICISLIMVAMLFAGCGKEKLYESAKSGYSNITAVSGVTFDIPENVLTQATAVTSITQDGEYGNDTYLYKDGKTSYLLFNINSIVIAIENTTDYNFAESDDAEKTLERKGMNGIWFTPDGKSLDYNESDKSGVHKIIATVTADISISPDTYGTFAGKLACVNNGDYECTMFIGAPAESYDDMDKDQKKVVDHVVKSLTVTDDAASNNDSTTENKESETEKNVEKDDKENTASDNETITENENELQVNDTKETESDSTSPDEIVIETEDNTGEPEDLPDTETEPAATEAQIPAEESPSTENQDNSEKDKASDTPNYISKESNQGETGNGYSDIYHLLKIGERGMLKAWNNDVSKLKSEYITINKLYTGDEAVEIIKNYCNSKDCLYKYKDAPDGTSWHVVEYTLDKKPEELYVNIKIEGLDGEKLKYRGVSHTSRTHDIFSYMEKTDDGYSKLYCYYAVPNGCKEYMLECGDRDENNDTSATACYKISDY